MKLRLFLWLILDEDLHGKIKKPPANRRCIFKWLGYLDSNQGNEGVKVLCLTAWLYPKKMVEDDRFELPNPKELIYSQPRLTTSLILHKQTMVEANGLEPLTLCL